LNVLFGLLTLINIRSIISRQGMIPESVLLPHKFLIKVKNTVPMGMTWIVTHPICIHVCCCCYRRL